jgi:hypothetical protein
MSQSIIYSSNPLILVISEAGHPANVNTSAAGVAICRISYRPTNTGGLTSAGAKWPIACRRLMTVALAAFEFASEDGFDVGDAAV